MGEDRTPEDTGSPFIETHTHVIAYARNAEIRLPRTLPSSTPLLLTRGGFSGETLAFPDGTLEVSGALREELLVCKSSMAEAKVSDTEGNLVALGTGAFRVFEKKGNAIV